MLKEFVGYFKDDVNKLLDNLYEDLEQAMNDAMFNMSFVNDDVEAHYEMLEQAMSEIIQEKVGMLLAMEEESK